MPLTVDPNGEWWWWWCTYMWVNANDCWRSGCLGRSSGRSSRDTRILRWSDLDRVQPGPSGKIRWWGWEACEWGRKGKTDCQLQNKMVGIRLIIRMRLLIIMVLVDGVGDDHHDDVVDHNDESNPFWYQGGLAGCYNEWRRIPWQRMAELLKKTTKCRQLLKKTRSTKSRRPDPPEGSNKGLVLSLGINYLEILPSRSSPLLSTSPFGFFVFYGLLKN